MARESAPEPRSVNPWAARGEAWNEAAPYIPFLDGPPAEPQSWYDDFLGHLALHGSAAIASMHARTGEATIYRYRNADPIFAAEIERARAYYRDHLEWELVHTSRVTGNPLGYFGRLKRELPEHYIERHALLSVNAQIALGPADGIALLRALLDGATGTTRTQLALTSGEHPESETHSETHALGQAREEGA